MKISPRASRSLSSPSRSGRRQRWFQPGPPPALHPQSSRPAAHPVGAAPRALGEQLHLPRRSVRLEVRRQVGHGESPLRRLPGEQGGQAHVAELLVVAEGFAVRRDEDQGLGESRRRVGDPARQRPGIPQVVLETDPPGDRRMVEADVDSPVALRPPLRILEVPAVWAPRVQLRLRRRDPPGLSHRTPAGRLRRREDHVAHAGPRQERQGRGVHGRLGQPHGFGVPAEAVLELAEAPVDLGLAVPRRCQRQDHVVVRLGDGVAVVEPRLTGAVGGTQGLDDGGRLLGHPGQERGPHVEAQPLVVVDDVLDAPLQIQHAGPGVGRIAFVRDPRVPVVKRRRALLPFDCPGPGVLAGRLIEVPVDHQMNGHSLGSIENFKRTTDNRAFVRFVSCRLSVLH